VNDLMPRSFAVPARMRAERHDRHELLCEQLYM
jgi:hypothetical protein